jgi:hypothetical protein
MQRKIITVEVEFADYGGEENVVLSWDVLAETLHEAERKITAHFEHAGQRVHVKSLCWNKSVIDGDIANRAEVSDAPSA